MTDASVNTLSANLEFSLKEIGIPPRPVILERISTEMQREEPDFNHLADLIATDVALAASLIKLTNSPYFGFRSRVRSPNEALMLLGLNVASQAIAGIIMRRAFPTTPQLERFWDASAKIAKLAGWLANNAVKTRLHSSDAYTLGLFRDCGIPILFSRNHAYHAVIEAANHEPIKSFTDVEDAFLPTNHAIVGGMLTQSWWLPEDISLAVRQHHDLQVLNAVTIPPTMTVRTLIAVTHLAEHLLQSHTGLSHTLEWPKFQTACLQQLDLNEDDLRHIDHETVAITRSSDY